MSPTIIINQWNEKFENADTRKRERLKSFHAPSGLDSRGYVVLTTRFPQQDSLLALGVFQAMCQYMATLGRKQRGSFIHSDGSPMDIDVLAATLRIEADVFKQALDILAHPSVRWISMPAADNGRPSVDSGTTSAESGSSSAETSKSPPIQQSANPCRTSATSCRPSPGFVQGEGEGEGEGEDTPLPPEGAVCASKAPAIVRLYPRHENVAKAIALVAKDIEDGTDPDEIIAGTKAIAAVISQLPSGKLNRYVPSAVNFFKDKRWMDDPATWLRQEKPKPAPSGNLGGLQLTEDQTI